MKFAIAFLTFYLIIVSISISQELTYCENGQTRNYSKMSVKNVLVGFKDDLYIEDIDELIEEINLIIFTYANDVLIIDRSINTNRENRTVEYVVLQLSKNTKEQGVMDLILTLKDYESVSYANPFFYTNINKNRISYTNKINVKLKRKVKFDCLEKLSEKYKFSYEYGDYGFSIKIELLPDANIDATKLSCVLFETGYFEYARLNLHTICDPPCVSRNN